MFHARFARTIGHGLLPLALSMCAFSMLPSTVLSAEPAIFWNSDPVRPGEAVVVVGEGFGDQPTVEVARLPDSPATEPSAAPSAWPAESQKVEAVQASNQSVKFVLPATLKSGVLAYRITGPGGAVVGLLNRPRVWWAQGDLGVSASPGGWVRTLGKNLGAGPEAKTMLRLQGPKTVLLAAQADTFAGKVALPADLPTGDYQLAVQSGFGGNAAWSLPLAIAVAARPAWPQTVFNVKDLGAEGNGVKDDTGAVQAAIEKAGQAGGGVVYFPRGRYRLSEGLTIPRFTVLRGEKRELAALCWADFPTPPEALVKGTNSFGLEDLTLYAKNHRHVIVGDLGSVPEAGSVFLRRLRVRADLYRGHPTPEEVDKLFRDSLRWSTGGGDTVRLGGRAIEITDCDLYGSGRALFLSRTRGGLVAGNQFYNGRWGWYCISGSDGLIFEDNTLTGGDLMSTGGGLNCLDGSSYSQNIYYARNQLRLMHGWDREAMTSDAGGEAYFGKLQTVQGAKLTLAAEPKHPGREWIGAGVFVLNGKGAGQYRRVKSHQGKTVELDQPWTVEPDANSDLCITMFQGHYLIVDNQFTDSGAMQFYGTSIECFVSGNRGTRMQGFRGLGLWYHGFQPSWFCQFLDNQITEGNYYHWDGAAEAFIEVMGAKHGDYDGSLNRGSVVRRNRLDGNAHVRVAGTCRDAIVEGNRVQDADQGVFVSRQCADVLVRANEFQRVLREVVDEEAIRKAAEERLKRYLGRREPVAVWSFDTLKGTKFVDDSGSGFSATIQGGAAQVAGGVRGQAVRLDGTGLLRVEEPAVFNAPDITVSFWVKPARVSGRWGLVTKRFAGTAAPFVISQNGPAVGLEACEEGGPWTFNFASPAVLQKDQWSHVAVTVRQGDGMSIYVGGRAIAQKKNAAVRATNTEPLILGREAWGGDPPKGDQPGFFQGLLDEVKIWTRVLAPEEIQAEAAAGKK